MASTPPPPPNGWTRYEEFVLRELQRLAEATERIEGCLSKQGKEIATLKARAGGWGLLGGLLVAVPAAIWALLRLSP